MTVVLLEKSCNIKDDILLCNHLYIQSDDVFELFDKIIFSVEHFIEQVDKEEIVVEDISETQIAEFEPVPANVIVPVLFKKKPGKIKIKHFNKLKRLP